MTQCRTNRLIWRPGRHRFTSVQSSLLSALCYACIEIYRPFDCVIISPVLHLINIHKYECDMYRMFLGARVATWEE